MPALPLSVSGKGFGLVSNRFRKKTPIEAPSLMASRDFETASAEIQRWPDYAMTPLLSLGWAAESAGVAEVMFKHEASRFGLQSFKALGGAYAVRRLAADWLANGNSLADLTVCCTSDGNHGRSVAWGAAETGCQAVVYVPENMADARRRSIEILGARTVTVPNYDEGIRLVAADAKSNGWMVVSDTAYDGYTTIPQHVMCGYGLIAEEASRQWQKPPTHLFLQAGVGGMAAALALRFEQLGHPMTLVVCEAQSSACWHRSIAEGAWSIAGGNGTMQAGLDCGEPSILSWEMLKENAAAGCWVDDGRAAETMRLLASNVGRVEAGDSAVAGLAALLAVSATEAGRAVCGLTPESRIFVLGSEGITDPVGYEAVMKRRI